MPNQTFHNIVLMARPGINRATETLNAICDYLLQQKVNVCIEENTAKLISHSQCKILSHNQLPEKTDLIIVIGGDGSLLNAAHIAVKHDLPVLGVNRGRLGFLTDIYPDELNKIGDVLHGNYIQETRFLLHTIVSQENQVIYEDIALNDIVLLQGKTPQLIEFEIFINERFVCRQRADGLIVTTPTGSTAYALSGGGPILHPQIDAIALVPMLPHTLSSRPIVINANSIINLNITSHESNPDISCDGQQRHTIPFGSNVKILKHSQSLKLIHPQDYNYFSTLREKLGWEKYNHESRSK